MRDAMDTAYKIIKVISHADAMEGVDRIREKERQR